MRDAYRAAQREGGLDRPSPAGFHRYAKEPAGVERAQPLEEKLLVV
jgi:hypothetical protein